MRVLVAVWDGYCPQAMIHVNPTDSPPRTGGLPPGGST